MSERFYVPDIGDSESVKISDSEARHISRVMRLGAGDEVVLFDGKGHQCPAIIESVGKHSVTMRPGELQALSREAPLKVIAAVALPKGDRLKFMVEKLTELGLARIIPLVSARSSVRPKGNTVHKMRRYVIEASKQCGRNLLMTVSDPMTLEDLLVQSHESSAKFCCDPASKNSLNGLSAKHADEVWFLVGPEGGLTDQETATAIDADWTLVNLGSRILRTETAAIATCVAALSLFQR